jgi:hypothetical protein
LPSPIFPVLPPPPTPEVLELTKNEQHSEQAIYRLLEQFQDKARFKTLIDIYTEAFQDIEEAFWDLYTKRRLDTAEGDQLRILGRIVGLVKGTTSDVDFRVLVAARIRVLLSRGTLDDLLRIMTIVLGGPGTRIVYEVFPAMIRVELTAVPAFSTVILGRLLRAAKAGGVRLDIDYPPPSGDWFTFNTVAGGGSTALGFMNVAGSTGGQFGQAA